MNSPIPWALANQHGRIVDANKKHIAYAEAMGGIGWQLRDANAAHIVRCVNSHDALVSALKAAQDALLKTARPDSGGDMPDPLLEQITTALEGAAWTPETTGH